MKPKLWGCQVCITEFKYLSELKNHMSSGPHRGEMSKIFRKVNFKSPGFFPYITVREMLFNEEKVLITGLSMLTLCFSPETNISFYLCHVCEENVPLDNIRNHIYSADHCSNYLGFTNPDSLRFSWIPSTHLTNDMKGELVKEVRENGSGQLQVLDLPEYILRSCVRSKYSEVMRMLNENAELMKRLEASKPERMMIQTYQMDKDRKHPLLGMQHVVECICAGSPGRRHYLCTLCNLTLASHMIIKHVLSFDHIFCYFREWHPGTLTSKGCYVDHHLMVRRFAKEAEDIHRFEINDIKQVTLEPDQFSSVNFTCYAEAFKKLESITKEKEKGSLAAIIQPGEKLDCETTSYRLHCQDCDVTFKRLFLYSQHVKSSEHKQMLAKLFVKVNAEERTKAHDGNGFSHSESLKENLKKSLISGPQCIGFTLAVMCLSTEAQAEPVCVCFACEECFPASVLKLHCFSVTHLINTLTFSSHTRLVFGWKEDLDLMHFRSLAQAEESRRSDEAMMKIFDIPHCIFGSLLPTYENVMATLKPYHTVLKCKVPLKQKEGGFPLLGQQFLVVYGVNVKHRLSSDAAFLCLLCQRKLAKEEFSAHIFSWEHVTSFLAKFHSCSLNSGTDTETLLDLAKQAARLHPKEDVQVIHLDLPIREPCTYLKARNILGSVKRKRGHGPLQPVIKTEADLVLRRTVKAEDTPHIRDTSGENNPTMNCSKKPTEKEDKPTSKKSQQAVHLRDYVQEEGRKAVVGLDAVVECCCPQREPFYLCTCCSMKIPQKDVVNHLVGLIHRKQYLVESQNLAVPAGIHVLTILRDMAALFEENHGHGEARVVHLDEETYSKMSKQNFAAAMQTVKALMGQQDSPDSLLTSARSAVQPVEASATRHAQRELRSDVDHFQVVKIEMDDDSQSSLTAPESVTTHTASKTIGVPPELKECVKRPQVQSPESAASAAVPQRVSRSSDDASSPHVPTKTPHAHSVPAGSAVKTKVNPTAAPLNLTTGKRRHSHSDVTTSTKPTPTPTPTLLRSTSLTSDVAKPAEHVCFLKPITPSSPAASKVRAGKSVSFASTATSTSTNCTAASLRMIPETASKDSQTRMWVKTQGVAPSAGRHGAEGCSAAAPVKNAAGRNADVPKSDAPAAPHPPRLPPAASENKPSKGGLKVGLNHLVIVRCKEKKQVYCLLCGVKLLVSGSAHLSSHSHKYNCVKHSAGRNANHSLLLRNLDKAVADLAQFEKNVGSRLNQTVEVNSHVYNELAELQKDKAVERVKVLLRDRDSNIPEDLSLQPASLSPCNSSSPNSDMESMSNKGGDVAAAQLDRAQSLKSSEPEADDWTSDPPLSPPTLIKKEPEPITAAPRIQGTAERPPSQADPPVTHPDATGRSAHVKDIPHEVSPLCLDNIKQEPLEHAVDSHTMTEVRPPAESPAKTERPQSQPAAFPAHSDGRDTRQETAESRRQQETRDPRDPPESSAAAGSVNTDSSLHAASANAERQNQSRSKAEADHGPDHSGCGPGPGQHLASQPPVRISGERTQRSSLLRMLLSSKELRGQNLIGVGLVWECQGHCLPTFFLCEICSERLFLQDIVSHMVSYEHRAKYLWRRDYLALFDSLEDEKFKQELFDKVVEMLSQQECSHSTRMMLLRKDLHQRVKMAEFSEALKLVKNLDEHPEQMTFCPPVSPVQQKESPNPVLQGRFFGTHGSNTGTPGPEAKRSREESLQTKQQSAHETGQRSVSEETKRSERSDVQEAFEQTVRSPLDAAVSALPAANASHHSSTETLEIKVEQVHGRSESPSSSVSPETLSQTLSASRTRKRSASTPPEPSDPDTEGPLSSKRTCISLQPNTESSSVIAAARPPSSRPKDDVGPVSSQLDDQQFRCIMEIVKKMKSEKCSLSGQDSAVSTTSCPGGSPEGGEERSDPWSPQDTNASEVMSPTALPAVSCEKQLVQPDVGVTEAKAALGTTVTSGEPGDPWSSPPAQSKAEPPSSEATSHNPSPTPKLETGGSWGDYFPINSIISTRPDHWFVGPYNGQPPPQVNRGQFSDGSFPVAPPNTADPGAAPGAYDVYSKMSVVPNAHASGYLSAENAAGSTKQPSPGNHPMFSGNPYQSQGYGANVFYTNPIYPQQGAHFYATQEMLQQQQQQQQQQHFYPWTWPPLTAAGDHVTNGPYLQAAAFAAPANRFPPAQNGNMNYHVVYQPFFNYPPPASGDVTSQANGINNV